jgi:outer membrane beta-barrel protein
VKQSATLVSAALSAAASLYGVRASAQERAHSHSMEIYGGEFVGNGLTGAPVSGRRPVVDDNVTFGARYTFNITDAWGVQLSGGYAPTRVARAAGGDANLGLTTVGADVVWNFTPQYRIVGYALAGPGYAWSHMKNPVVGLVRGQPSAIRDGSGFTASVGIGAKYYATDHVFIDLQSRYRVLDRIVNTSSQSVNTAEFSVGVGWRF